MLSIQNIRIKTHFISKRPSSNSNYEFTLLINSSILKFQNGFYTKNQSYIEKSILFIRSVVSCIVIKKKLTTTNIQ